jgi:hypothetical protein
MKKLIEFLKNWNELLTLPLAVILFHVGGKVIFHIDNTAGVYDIGILQAFLLATVGILFGHALIWLVIKIAWPAMYELLDDCITEEKWLTTWQKVQFSLYYWVSLLIAWAILVAGLS